MASPPRISFGMIVLNGMPFVLPCIRAIYEYAHEIVVVEGAVEAARTQATADGHSVDGTLQALKDFPDPDGKLRVLSRDSFWSEKDEMCNEYMHHCTGDYVWQIDSDEFYQPTDIERIIQVLTDDPGITSVSFLSRTFFGGFDTIAVGGRRDEPFHRIKKIYAGAHYLTHRPPTILTKGGQAMRDIREVHAYDLERQKISLYHYAYVLPKQVQRKVDYYDTGVAGPAGNADLSDWTRNVYQNLRTPLQTDIDAGKPSWLELFEGRHPPEIQRLIESIERGEQQVCGQVLQLPNRDDIRDLLQHADYSRATVRASRLNGLYRAHILMVEWGKSVFTPSAWCRARRAGQQILRQFGKGLILDGLLLSLWWLFLTGWSITGALHRRIRLGGAISLLIKRRIARRTSRL